MGNASSYSKQSEPGGNGEFRNFYEMIDFIATYYILTMNFKSLSNLSNKDYCNKMVILTADIIKNHFNEQQITYLAQRIKDGTEVNELTSKNVTYVNKDTLEGLDASNDKQKSITKKRMCIGIAKFYVKIAHVFAAIVMTINPVYTYKDADGNVVKTGLLNKDKIPKNVNRKLDKLNICDNRIKALRNGLTIDEKSKEATLFPKICGMNLDKSGQSKTLIEEPGINELLTLYLDDEYDYSNGTFKGMSEKTKQIFKRDLQTFYTAFTGNMEMPNDIQKFGDIKLRDYNDKQTCLNGILKTPNTISSSEELFVKYAENINNMINNASKNQQKLLAIINSLFSFTTNPYTKKKQVRVNPKLTDQVLQENVEKTRKFIIDLYVKCELDYVNGIKIYEAIVEKKIIETTQNQIKSLKQRSQDIIKSTQSVTKDSAGVVPIMNPVSKPMNVTPIMNPVSKPMNVTPVMNPVSKPMNVIPVINPLLQTNNVTPVMNPTPIITPLKTI